ncbi:hypothetical protein DF185_08020 [Marinifilum breve]|uniref:Uncharacterized protein n=1 Tax=Marinifilum breve TaxID=2184082 RepID=A0A2V3ZY72_9BACT|nr:hypothetical protein [Marinifilum breve]PXY01422.1 hypothetical protein DF185_08020 [Marinifilum breve]
MSERNHKFDKLYKLITNVYPKVIDLDEDNVKKLSRISMLDIEKYKSRDYLLLSITISLILGAIPFVLYESYVLSCFLEDYFFSNRIFIDETQIILISLGFGIASVFLIKTIFGKNDYADYYDGTPKYSSVYKYSRGEKKYRLFIFIVCYILLGILGNIIGLNLEFIREFIEGFSVFYLFLPIAILLTFLTAAVIIFVVNIPIEKLAPSKYSYSSNIRIEIIYHLLIVLENIENINKDSFLDHGDVINLSDKLLIISGLIRDYPEKLNENIIDNNLSHDFDKTANHFWSITVDFIKNQESNMDSLIKHLINYLNVFLKGNLSDLPKSESAPNKIGVKSVKYYHYIFLALYLTLPILVVVSLKLYTNVKIDDYIQSLLTVLYVIWAFVGIFSNPIIFTSENKDLMKDVIKTLIGKS